MGTSKVLHLTLSPLALAASVTAAVALLAGSESAEAQELELEEGAGDQESAPAGPIQIGLFLGGNYLSPENELGNSVFDDQVPGSGFLLGARINYLFLDSIAPESGLNPQLRAEVEGKYTFSDTDGGMGRGSVDTPVVGWRMHAIVDMYPQNIVTPFALVGVGGETVFGSNLFMTSPDTDFATYWGGGMRVGVSEELEMRLDLRFGATASREDALSSLFELHAGIAYNFGFAEEAQESGFVEEEPSEPVRLDRDHDGIADARDTCPDLAETINDIDDEDGCPEIDSDHDGLLGSQDQCPAAAEDMDKYQDEDGCPDPDNDGDGRPDAMDQCPNKAENLNGYQDEDGCPDTIPEQVKAFTGKIVGIKFRTGSARIFKKSHRILNAAYEVLKANPSVRIEISGHTDSSGGDALNRLLSQKRADYVKWYLVDKGIDAERIVTVGHGLDKPIDSNATDAGRTRNRRIEFTLLPGATTVKAR